MTSKFRVSVFVCVQPPKRPGCHAVLSVSVNEFAVGLCWVREVTEACLSQSHTHKLHLSVCFLFLPSFHLYPVCNFTPFPSVDSQLFSFFITFSSYSLHPSSLSFSCLRPFPPSNLFIQPSPSPSSLYLDHFIYSPSPVPLPALPVSPSLPGE